MAKKKTDVVPDTSTQGAPEKTIQNGKVKIKLPKDRGSNADPRGVYVAVNGVAMFIPRGVEVEIPKAYYEVLMNSIQAEEDADDFIATEINRKNYT